MIRTPMMSVKIRSNPSVMFCRAQPSEAEFIRVLKTKQVSQINVKLMKSHLRIVLYC